eukprot:UN24979
MFIQMFSVRQYFVRSLLYLTYWNDSQILKTCFVFYQKTFTYNSGYKYIF